MAVGAIPLSDILAYMEMFDIKGFAQRTEFLRRIKILDNAYLDWHLKEKSK